ncbi:hypothetical protein PYW07_015318 [Mythimna separata]|uniref:Uncharacterized protein n=1 Tax=Mythimna separata TaxID=271217 RepID=A0AAD7YYB1_MYTSE|nr:hypothetical protein PYW07_015318 [Mythimna separata]
MKLAIVFAAVMAVSAAQLGAYRPPPSAPRPVATRVASSDQAANVLRYDNDIQPDGTFGYAVQIDNGINTQVQGAPRDFGGNPPIRPIVYQGEFSWTSPEGQPINIKFVADENGYSATGDAIPTSPPIPDLIAKSLAYLQKAQKK